MQTRWLSGSVFPDHKVLIGTLNYRLGRWTNFLSIVPVVVLKSSNSYIFVYL